jgi:hypothetical protein
MTPADQEFITLWNEGWLTTEIAARLRKTTRAIQSQAHRFQQKGLISTRPRGGNYPTERARGRAPGEGPPSTVHRPP